MDEDNEYIALREAHELLLDKIEQLTFDYANNLWQVEVELKVAAKWIANRLQEIENEEYDKTLTGERAV
tara:strand:+ start:184 stop:390 length:207 start_codon:yes stop_codon:yes gene_type:complete